MVSTFTKIELQILNLIARGLILDDIALELNISKYMTKLHIESIYKKLNVKNRVQAVVKAITQDIIRV